MKDFLKNYNKLIVLGVLAWLILFVLLLVNSGFSLVKVNKFNATIQSKESKLHNGINWEGAELRNLYKEKLWLEQQLELAKSDSFSLGINLKDSIVQVQLKGTVLFQAKIVRQKPSGFFDSSDKETYLNYFAEISRIDSSVANFEKKPIKKVKAPSVGQEPESVKSDTMKNERLHWEFRTTHDIHVVIKGVWMKKDSTGFDVPFKKDVYGYRIRNGMKNTFSIDYNPVLFLWLNDNEAKAVYRALPDNPKCIFRN